MRWHKKVDPSDSYGCWFEIMLAGMMRQTRIFSRLNTERIALLALCTVFLSCLKKPAFHYADFSCGIPAEKSRGCLEFVTGKSGTWTVKRECQGKVFWGFKPRYDMSRWFLKAGDNPRQTRSNRMWKRARHDTTNEIWHIADLSRGKHGEVGYGRDQKSLSRRRRRFSSRLVVGYCGFGICHRHQKKTLNYSVVSSPRSPKGLLNANPGSFLHALTTWPMPILVSLCKLTCRNGAGNTLSEVLWPCTCQTRSVWWLCRRIQGQDNDLLPRPRPPFSVLKGPAKANA